MNKKIPIAVPSVLIMERYSGKTTTDKNDVGRPIIVYDDDLGEANNERPTISSEIRISKIRRLPGRDISISSDEDEEDDNSQVLKTIEIVEDPTKKNRPRKSSMIVNGAGKQGGTKKLEIVDSLNQIDKNLTTSSSANELCKTTKFEELASPLDPNFIPIRKRSVSFLPASSEKTMDIKSSSTPASAIGSGDLTRDKSLQEDEEDEEVQANAASMDHLQVSDSDRARERRRSIEELVRPPTPPNACHSIKN